MLSDLEDHSGNTVRRTQSGRDPGRRQASDSSVSGHSRCLGFGGWDTKGPLLEVCQQRQSRGGCSDRIHRPQGAAPRQELCHGASLARRLPVTPQQAGVVLVGHTDAPGLRRSSGSQAGSPAPPHTRRGALAVAMAHAVWLALPPTWLSVTCVGAVQAGTWVGTY